MPCMVSVRAECVGRASGVDVMMSCRTFGNMPCSSVAVDVWRCSGCGAAVMVAAVERMPFAVVIV